MADSAAEKTELPTGRRLQESRGKGNVPQIQELVSVATLLTLVVTIAMMSHQLAGWATALTREGLSCQTRFFTNGDAFLNFINAKIIDSIVICLPILAAITMSAILVSIAVIGPVFAPGAVTMKFDVLNPTAGLNQIFNSRSMVKLLISILKLILLSIIICVYLTDKIDTLMQLRWTWSTQIITATGSIIFGLCIRICIALLMLAIADTLYQKWKYIEDLKMTKQEIKQETRDTEGAPEVKSRIRRIQLQMSMKRMMREVPKAKVVLVNPTHIAVALKYETSNMDAPVVVAKGADQIAEKIMEVARAYGVPIVRRPQLARTIFATVKIDEPIPQNLYVAVAEVMAILHRLRKRRR